MKSNRARICGALLALLLPCCSPAQQNKLIVRTPDPIAAKPGSTVVESLEVSVLPGFHVNSDKPKDEFLIPLRLTWSGSPLQPQGQEFPAPEEIKVGGQDLVVFTGNFRLRTRFAVRPDAPAGRSELVGKLSYQACNNQMCFRPSSVEFRVPVTIQ